MCRYNNLPPKGEILLIVSEDFSFEWTCSLLVDLSHAFHSVSLPDYFFICLIYLISLYPPINHVLSSPCLSLSLACPSVLFTLHRFQTFSFICLAYIVRFEGLLDNRLKKCIYSFEWSLVTLLKEFLLNYIHIHYYKVSNDRSKLQCMDYLISENVHVKKFASQCTIQDTQKVTPRYFIKRKKVSNWSKYAKIQGKQ